MENSNAYVITGEAVDQDSDTNKYYWNSQQLSFTQTVWTHLLSEAETYSDEEKINEVLEKLLNLFENTKKKNVKMKNFKIEAIDKRTLMIAKLKGT